MSNKLRKEMIVDNINECKKYEGLNEAFKLIFDYVNSHDMLHAPLGRIELDGQRVFINNDAPQGKKKADAPLEYHRRYIDIHIILKGCETIGWRSLGTMKSSQEFNEAKDIAFSSDRPTAYVTLHPGDFMIVYPEDMHAPNIGRGQLRKVVAKIML